MAGKRNIRVAIIGASGYTGAELLRLLLRHPALEIVCATSRQYAGRSFAEVFPRYGAAGEAARQAFVEPSVRAVIDSGAEAVFLALPHGVAAEFAVPLLEAGLRIVDLSADFRLRDPAVYEEFYGAPHPAPELLEKAVYGLPEIYGDAIAGASLVASPGCYPTSILLPLLPQLRVGNLDAETLVSTSMSGVSGAGKKADPSLLYVECNESVRPYGVPMHRHLGEMEQELSLAQGAPVRLSFNPHLVPVNAGICSSTVAALAEGRGGAEVARTFEEAYGESRFVRLLGEGGFPDTKNVTGTNHIEIGWVIDGRTGRCVLMSAEDNLGKGAGGQAVQSFNLMFDLEETLGLANF
ncbi:MAG: N-acetyl-gamma-glutamyl-phosphate reductase [Verrucomicrobiales bacterium]